MIIQPETIFIRLFNDLSQESWRSSTSNSEYSKYWALKTDVETKKRYVAMPIGDSQLFPQRNNDAEYYLLDLIDHNIIPIDANI